MGKINGPAEKVGENNSCGSVCLCPETKTLIFWGVKKAQFYYILRKTSPRELNGFCPGRVQRVEIRHQHLPRVWVGDHCDTHTWVNYFIPRSPIFIVLPQGSSPNWLVRLDPCPHAAPLLWAEWGQVPSFNPLCPHSTPCGPLVRFCFSPCASLVVSWGTMRHATHLAMGVFTAPCASLAVPCAESLFFWPLALLGLGPSFLFLALGGPLWQSYNLVHPRMDVEAEKSPFLCKPFCACGNGVVVGKSWPTGSWTWGCIVCVYEMKWNWFCTLSSQCREGIADLSFILLKKR